MQPSILSLVGVMVQVDAVEAGLHLAALPSHHMAAAPALPRLHGTPGTPAALSALMLPQMPLAPCVPMKTHRLSWAPPTSQSHGRQPGRSWLSPQCSGWRGQGCQGALGCGAVAPSTMHGSEHRARPPSTMPGSKHIPTHQALVAVAPGHQPLAEALAADGITPGALGHCAAGVTLAPCMESQRCLAGPSLMPDPSRCHPGTYAGSPVGWWR